LDHLQLVFHLPPFNRRLSQSQTFLRPLIFILQIVQISLPLFLFPLQHHFLLFPLIILFHKPLFVILIRSFLKSCPIGEVKLAGAVLVQDLLAPLDEVLAEEGVDEF